MAKLVTLSRKVLSDWTDFQETTFHDFGNVENINVSFRLFGNYVADINIYYYKTFNVYHNMSLRKNTVAPLLPIGPLGPGVPSSPFKTLTEEI